MAGYSILYKYIPLPPIRTKHVEGVILGQVSKYGRAMKSDFEALVSTWRHNPGFKMTIGYKGGDLFASVTTEDPIFGYLNDGTGVRYATMTDDFIPKTTPGALSSGSGQGGVQYVNRKIPRPGIEARHFTTQMRERYERAFIQDVENEIMNALRGMK